MKRNIFLVNDFDKQFILEMHKKATQKNYVNFNIIEEQKQNAKSILTGNGFNAEDANEIAQFSVIKIKAKVKQMLNLLQKYILIHYHQVMLKEILI